MLLQGILFVMSDFGTVSDRPDPRALISGPEALLGHWRSLMGPLGFTERVLWLLFVDARRYATTVLTQVERLPLEPDVEIMRNVMQVATHVVQTTVVDGSLALLLSRPGRGQLCEDDRGWARGLTFAAAEVRLPLHPVHIATCDEIRRFAPDDLIPSDRAAGQDSITAG
jgi:hypothetical protein